MNRKHDKDRKAAPEAEIEPEEEALADQELEEGIAAVAEAPAPAETDRFQKEAAEWKDRALRTAADMENYRKRAIRERDEAGDRGQAMVLGRVVDVIDDLARVAHLDPANTSAEALHEGMLAIERKLLKALETSGLERLDPAGEPFDPTTQEAVASLPAPDEQSDHTVAQVYQPGYRFKGNLLRPARVAVYQWKGDSA